MAATAAPGTAERHDPIETWWPGLPSTPKLRPSADNNMPAEQPSGDSGGDAKNGVGAVCRGLRCRRSPASAGRPSIGGCLDSLDSRASALAKLKPAYGAVVIGLWRKVPRSRSQRRRPNRISSAVVLRPRPKRIDAAASAGCDPGGQHVGGVAAACRPNRRSPQPPPQQAVQGGLPSHPVKA